MLRGAATQALVHGSKRVPGLRALPVGYLIAIAEIALLARTHTTKLDGAERRRLFELVRVGRGRRRNLSAGEREELSALVAKAEPRLFAGEAVQAVSPIPLPKRLTHGKRRKRA